MKINAVTMTGADGSISPKEMVDMAIKYPFVEWGILVSNKCFGTNRFPAIEWLDELSVYADQLKLSCHLCGQYVRDILMGRGTFIDDLGPLWNMFKRVQINTHGIEHEFDGPAMVELLKGMLNKEFIYQYDNKNYHILAYALANGVNASTLFDTSHGAGQLPEKWPFPIQNISCGYAGGLGPDNIQAQLPKIAAYVSAETEVWIDMETHIRSDNDHQFDLFKVEKVLSICKESGYVL